MVGVRVFVVYCVLENGTQAPDSCGDIWDGPQWDWAEYLVERVPLNRWQYNYNALILSQLSIWMERHETQLHQNQWNVVVFQPWWLLFLDFKLINIVPWWGRATCLFVLISLCYCPKNLSFYLQTWIMNLKWNIGNIKQLLWGRRSYYLVLHF